MDVYEMPSKFRVSASVDEELLKKLELWAEEENRSTSSLCSTILREACTAHDAGIYIHSQSFPTKNKNVEND